MMRSLLFQMTRTKQLKNEKKGDGLNKSVLFIFQKARSNYYIFCKGG